MDKIVSKSLIVDKLHLLGLKEDALVVAHSSLRNFGYVIGGAETVIDALLEVVGEKGTVMMPTFTPSVSASEFDLQKTSSETGIITEAFRHRRGVIRSNDPRHSFAAIGKEAFTLIKGDYSKGTTRYIDGPLGRLYRNNGTILLFGVGQRRNTSLHIAEEIAGMYTPSYHGEAFGKMDYVLKELGILKVERIGNSVTQFMKAKEIIDATVEILYKDPLFLWCGNNNCKICANMRREIKEKWGK